MKKMIISLALVVGLSLCLTVGANAQAITQGTVDFSVSVPAAFDIRSNGSATVSSGVTASLGNANSALGMTLTVADASPNVSNAALTAAVPIRLRSNLTYKLTAFRANLDAASNADFDSSDIGMSISYNARSGAQVNTGGSDNPATGWQTGGNKTVADLNDSGVQIATGDRISLQGNNTASSPNFVTASLNFTIARQYYTPTSTPFTQQVTVGISAAP
jgi:hypothetical protein